MEKQMKKATALILSLLLVVSVGITGVIPHLSAEEGALPLAEVSSEEEWALVKEQYQVSTVSPSNATIHLFDYWTGDDRDAPEAATLRDTDPIDYPNRNVNGFQNLGINDGHALLFRRTNPNMGTWNNGGDTGLVQSKLGRDGYPVLNLPDELLAQSGLSDRPGRESLAYLFSPNLDHSEKLSFANAQGLLQLDEEGNYFFDSSRYFAAFEEATKTFAVYDVHANGQQEAENIGFFPFNALEEIYDAAVDGDSFTITAKEKYTSASPVGTTHKDLNHYLGMTLEVDFQQPMGGMVQDDQPMTFHFSGDDDVWIFIDDVLVADLGGIHGRYSVDIDFSTGKITYGGNGNAATDTTLKAQFEAAGRLAEEDSFNGDTFVSSVFGESHTLKMFYLERGHNESNLELSFNLVRPINSKIIKLDQNGDPVQNAAFDLYQADENYQYENSDRIVSGLTTDENGEVELLDANGDAIEFRSGQHYVLKETGIPDGYQTPENSSGQDGEIWLYCETFHENNAGDDPTRKGTNLLLVEDKSIWESGAVSNITVTVTQSGSELQYQENVYPGEPTAIDSHRAQNGLILAVPWLRENTTSQSATDRYANMSPIYGSNLDGYHFAVDELDSEDNLELLQAALKAAMYQIYYANYGDQNYQNWYMAWYESEDRYYGTLTDLPGDATRYIWTQDGNFNPQEADLSVAYYFLDWSAVCHRFDSAADVGANQKLSAIAQTIQSRMETNGGDLDAAIDAVMGSVIQNSDGTTPGNFALLESDNYIRQFAMRLYVPNVAREWMVQKVDELGNPLSGAQFTLYHSSADSSAAEVAKGTTDENGMLVFSVKGTDTPGSAKAALEPGTYLLKETKSPEGYRLNSTPVTIQVTEHEIYADAGTEQDGVTVRKGVGKLVQSMVRYTNDVNVTLRDITATETTGAMGGIVSGSTSNGDTGLSKTNRSLDLHYGLESAWLEYGSHEGPDPVFETDTGVIGVHIAQNYNAHSGDRYDDPRSKEKDLAQYDISNLFSGSTTVVVANRHDSGTLTVHKEVLTPETGGQESFQFGLSFAAPAEGEKIIPLDGSYPFAIYRDGDVRSSGVLTLKQTTDSENNPINQWVIAAVTGNNNQTTFTLQDGDFLSIEDLPLATRATVTEQGVAGKKYTVYVTADGGSREDGTTITQGGSVSGSAVIGASGQRISGLPEAAASYEFGSGISDGGTIQPAGSSGVTISNGQVHFDSAAGRNSYRVQWDNPLKGKAKDGFSLSILMEPDAASEINWYDGLFSFGTGDGYFGMGGNGSLWFHDGNGNEFDFWRVSADTIQESRTFIARDEGEFLLTMAVSSDRVAFYQNSVLVYQITQADVDASEANSTIKHPQIFRDILDYVNQAGHFNLGCASPGNWGTAGFSAGFVKLYGSPLDQQQIHGLASQVAPEAYLLFENVEVADLAFDKTEVWGTSAPTGGYSFELAMTLPGQVPDGSYTYHIDSASSGSIVMEGGSGTGTITLWDGQTCTIENVPVGTRFTITETSAGYYTTITANNGSEITITDPTEDTDASVTGTLAFAGANLSFTNRQGTITVTKRDGAGNLLEGAGFTLYTADGSAPVGGEQTVGLYLRTEIQDQDLISNGRISIGKETYIVQNEAGETPFYYRPLTEEEIEQYRAGEFHNPDKVEAVVIFTGLDPDKTYLLRETTVPTNYLQASDIGNISFDTDDVSGIALPGDDLDLLYVVENHGEIILPSTGWQILFFGGVGLLLMAAGAALLLVRRRTSSRKP